jgi:hypothetical protein
MTATKWRETENAHLIIICHIYFKKRNNTLEMEKQSCYFQSCVYKSSKGMIMDYIVSTKIAYVEVLLSSAPIWRAVYQEVTKLNEVIRLGPNLIGLASWGNTRNLSLGQARWYTPAIPALGSWGRRITGLRSTWNRQWNSVWKKISWSDKRERPCEDTVRKWHQVAR